MRQFSLTDVEDQRYKEWAEAHMDECPVPKQDLFSTFTPVSSHTFKFTPTGIGDGITVECSCGASVDVTDTSVW